ncbi:MAG TPA: GMC family oxidoreductase [Microbacterium sp.]|nr:GMC family oxidoreductase [Microbacterium sp.]
MNTSQSSLPSHVDTLVIGGGTGGAAFTGVLAASSDETVLLVEAGADYGPYADGEWPSDMLDARSIPLSHDYDLHTVRTSGEGVLDLPRARILGGCSAHNGCTASVSARYDYDEWAALGNPGWSAAEVEPLLDLVHSRFRVRRYTMDELTPPQRAFVNAGLATGLPFADDLDDLEAAEGIGPMPVNVVDGVRWNSAFAFLDEVRERPNLTIAGGTHVTALTFEDGSVTGAFIERAGEVAHVSAERVVVAAGAYHSPAILLRSGIGRALVGTSSTTSACSSTSRAVRAWWTSSPPSHGTPTSSRSVALDPAGATAVPTTSTSSWSRGRTAGIPAFLRSPCTAARCARAPRVSSPSAPTWTSRIR